jgi:8-oxo-dGTP pyrophosphatase MutT (NUDIX family)
MLHLIPAPLHRLALRWAYHLRKRFRRLARRDLAGVSIIPLDGEDRVLLARHTYGPQGWALIGGGMGSREEPEAAARREVREELGCGLADLRLVQVLEETLSGSAHTAYVFFAKVEGDARPDLREIAELRWFAREDLAGAEMTRVTRWRLASLGLLPLDG